jgi:hypothetical protein
MMRSEMVVAAEHPGPTPEAEHLSLVFRRMRGLDRLENHREAFREDARGGGRANR